MKYLWLALFLELLSISSFAQSGKVKCTVLDATSEAPLSYATIQLMNAANDQLTDGGMTDAIGKFELETVYGNYYLLIDFIGYEQVRTKPFELNQFSKLFDLGSILLTSTAKELEEVVVQAEKSSMTVAFDKKVFNVGKDLGNAGGSAVDILNNVPTVIVDGNGAVKLRGSNNVRILIDGKPSALVSFEGGQGLQQLQASMIERIEIITNPSARYEAEGMAGIINIVLKKNQKNGFNGAFEATTGYPLNLGLGANMNYRHKQINFFINYGINYRIIPSQYSIYQEVYVDDSTFISTQDYEGAHTGFFNNIKGGADFFLTEQDIFTFSYYYSRAKGNRSTDLRYEDFVNSTNNPLNYTLRTQEEDEVEPISEYVLSYKKLFNREDHELNAEIRYFDHWEESDQIYTQNTFHPDGQPDRNKGLIQNSLNDEFETQLLAQVDYIHPFGEEGKFELGLRNSFRDMNNDYIVSEQNENGVFEALPGLDNNFIYKENISAAYGIYANKFQRFSYQVGLRAEWTGIETILEDTNEKNPRSYANLFPSAHISYKLPNDHALQLSYSYRIRRPVYNDLSPYVTFSDNRNFFSGNPDLNPEFSNVVELGHIKYFNKGSIASTVYYRHTDDKIEQLRIVNQDGFSNTQPYNLVREDAYGLELITSLKAAAWWKLDWSLNLFGATIDGSNIDEGFTAETFSWFTRATSRFIMPKSTTIQLRVNYEAPQNIAQGKRKSLYYLDLAINKKIWNDKGAINLNITDILNSRITRTILESTTFLTERDHQWIQRQINLTLSYKINQG